MAGVESSLGTEYGLFKSPKGIKLPMEVCLQIAENAIDIDHNTIQALMSLSKVSLGLFSSFVVLRFVLWAVSVNTTREWSLLPTTQFAATTVLDCALSSEKNFNTLKILMFLLGVLYFDPKL